MKKKISVLLVLAMLLSCAACSAAGKTTEQGETTPEASAAETYTTTGQGKNGAVEVATTIENGVIINVEVLKHSETAGVSDPAIEKIPSRIVDNNSIAVDVVSGATVTSQAIISAVASAIEEAGLDVNDYNKANDAQSEVKTINTQVLIIGAGGSGLLAANIAKSQGKDVLVIEKNANVTSCATALSGGGFIGAGSKAQKELLGVTEDSSDQVYADLLAGGGDNIDSMLRLLSDNCGKAVDYLYYDLGMPVKAASSSAEHTYARCFTFEGGAPAITTDLLEKYQSLNGDIMFETRATELITDNGTVIGAKATSPDSDYEIHADSTILATGGYGANKDLLPESVNDVLYYGPGTNTGDGLLMAEAVGADTVYLDHVKIYPQGIEIGDGIGAVGTGGSMTATAQAGAIYVNNKGVRVVNDNATFVEIREATKLQEGRMLYLVMDQPAFDIWCEQEENYKFLTQDQINTYLDQNGGTPLFAHADTIAEAAKIAGIDAAALTSTVDHWNEMVAAGEDKDFGNPYLNAIDEGPYYIVEQKLRFCSTLGGLVIDTDMHVLDTNGNVIPGLFAAGEVVGGAHGQDSMPCCNVGWALTTGYLVGYAVAK